MDVWSDITVDRVRVPLESLIERLVEVEFESGNVCYQTLLTEYKVEAITKSPLPIKSVSAVVEEPPSTRPQILTPDRPRQAPETVTPGTVATAGYPPDRGHQGVMHSDELGIALAELAGKRMRDDVGWIRSAFTSPGETKEAPPLPVAGFDHRLGAWR